MVPLPQSEAAFKPRVLLRSRALAHGGLTIGIAVLGAVFLAALLAPLLPLHDPFQQDLLQRLRPPVWHARGSWDHPLGTDLLGRDYLARLIWGARVSLLIGICATAVAGLIGTILGVAAGYFRGRVDMVVSYLVTVRLSMPMVLVILAVVSLIGASLPVLVAAIGLLNWDRFAVVTRSATLQVRNYDYVTAAQVIGCSAPRIVLTEILPNIASQLIVVATLEMAHAILIEAALSFLGLGVPPPLPSWGMMVAEGKPQLLFAPWLAGIPGGALFVLLLAINLIGDGVRDVTAPEGHG